MEVSASVELSGFESSTSSIDGCDSSRSSSLNCLNCHKTGASVESEICPSLLDALQLPRPSDLDKKQKFMLTHRQSGRSNP